MNSSERIVIALEGGIGAGKSTTASLVAEGLGVPAILEDTDKHPFLPAFYDQPSRYALETELGFVLLHAHEMKRVNAPFCIADFSIVKDLVFARLSLTSEELPVFHSVYEWATESIGRPQLVVFLEVDVETMLRRIRSRGRSYEQGISESYLSRLADEYRLHLSDLGEQVIRLAVAPASTPGDVANAVRGAVSDWLLDSGRKFPFPPGEG